MNMTYRSPTDIPEIVPVFPLAGALLLPRGQMPLNIFEPRYLAMVDEALRTDRVIAMIQPDPERDGKLFSVGCLGRLTQFAETGDGRYLLQLTGISRFRVIEEIEGLTPFRRCRITATPFAIDFTPRAGEDEVNRADLLKTLKDYLEANDLKADWDSIREAANEALVNALCMMSPFETREKQALLEAMTLKERAEILVAMTEIELARNSPGASTPMQ